MVPHKTAAPIFRRISQDSFNRNIKTTAQAGDRYRGLTLIQQAPPRSRPAVNASHTFFRLHATSNARLPASTNQAVGASAEGNAPYIASRGDKPAKKLEAIATRQPNAVTAIPVISRNETIKSMSHSTIWTACAE